jgi:predicted ATPase
LASRRGRGQGDQDGLAGSGLEAGEPFVDRERELGQLREHLSQLRRGPGRAVLMVGESGVGKSRLAAELAGEARQHQIRVLHVQCLGRGAEPLLPVKDALAEYLGHSPDRVRRALVTATPHLLDAVPFVGAFLGHVGEAVMEGPPLGGASMEGVYEALVRVLVGIAAKEGLLLVVEDLHAADGPRCISWATFCGRSRLAARWWSSPCRRSGWRSRRWPT